MSRKIEPHYDQAFLLPPHLEDWVGPEHPARFIREFVESMNLDDLGISWGSESTVGQPGFSAGLLLKVHLYARFLGVRSFRKMEAACRDHMGMLWLTGMVAPDHNTLWGFFARNKQSLRKVFRHSLQVALQANLVGLVLHALDGTKVQAAVANASGWHRTSLEKRLALLETAIAELEKQLEQSHSQTGPHDAALPEALRTQQGLRDQVRGALRELDVAGEAHLHPHDRDARVMKCRDRGSNTFSYNNQAMVDEHSGLIVAEEATNHPSDSRQLAQRVEQARQAVGTEGVTTADTRRPSNLPKPSRRAMTSW